MRVFKNQFEIRFTPILNFQTAYKPVLNPYLRQAEFNIQNPNTIEEYVVLRYKSESYQIECRWDKLIFISEGNRQDLAKPQGPLFTYFEIFKKISSLESFGVINNALSAISYLMEIDGEKESIEKRFKEKYVPNIGFNFPEYTEDFAVVGQYEQSNKIYKIQFGPFKYKKDVENFNLSPIHNRNKEYFKDFNGLLADSLYFEKLNFADLDTYRKMEQVNNASVAKISL